MKCKICGSARLQMDNSYTMLKCLDCGSMQTMPEEMRAAWAGEAKKANSTNDSITLHSNVPQSTRVLPTSVSYVVKVFYPQWHGNTKVSAESRLQKYLNDNGIDPNKIISITSTGNPSSGEFSFSLVHYL